MTLISVEFETLVSEPDALTTARISCAFFIHFFSVNAVVKQTPVLSFHTTQRAY